MRSNISRCKRTVALIAFCSVAGINSVAVAQPQYRAIRLLPDSTNVTGVSLNDQGQVLFSRSAGPLIWFKQNDSIYAPPGFDTLSNNNTAAAINNAGQVVGKFRSAATSNKDRGFIWSGSAIGQLRPENIAWNEDFWLSDPKDVNGSGIATGFATTPNDDSIFGGAQIQTARWSGAGDAVGLGHLAGYRRSQGFGISESGVIVGESSFPGPQGTFNSDPRACIWFGDAPTDLGALLGSRGISSANDVNINDWAVGWSMAADSSTDLHAVLWRNGQIEVIETPNFAEGIAIAINDSGQIVMNSGVSSNRAFTWENGVSYTLDDLIPGSQYTDGTPLGSMRKVYDINNRGDILAGTSFLGDHILLERIQPSPGLQVNSTGDAIDNNPGDGVCFTGNLNTIGDDECTLCAAIMEANALSGFDTITFAIPGGGVPAINLTKPLPAITESTVIDATGQADSGAVIVSGGLVPGRAAATVDGLTIQASHTEVRGLIIRGFSGNAVVIQNADSVTLTRNTMGNATSQDTIFANGGHGIYIISSSFAQIGDAQFVDANTIRDNGGAGIYVESGEGNTFRRNVITENEGLGIDLAPPGVNPNDSADVDAGPNQGENYPVIDSVHSTSLQTTIYGHVPSEPLAVHVVEIFVNDTCDATGFGEGAESVWSTTADAGSGTVAPFATTFGRVLDSGEVFTLTATDHENNTSEFSACFPNKVLELVDVNDAVIANKEFLLYRVTGGAPDHSDTLIDTVLTDAQGRVSLNELLRVGDLTLTDRIKLHRTLKVHPRARTGITTIGSSYSTHLDNAKFDSLSFSMFFDTLSAQSLQQIKLDHTTLTFNLIVSVEWDVEPAVYGSRLKEMFGLVSNYLYDVTDGQARLDTIVLLDDTLQWFEADIQILATNVERPKAYRKGMFAEAFRNLLMPRRWFGNEDLSRDSTVHEFPMDPRGVLNYRALAHELGHYVFGLGDEYDEGAPGMVNTTFPIYGFMQTPFPSAGAVGSEMSWSRQYEDEGRQNTPHWLAEKQSCWDSFDDRFAATYDNIPAPVIRPDERALTGGHDYFLGPNDDLNNLDYDVGALLVFPSVIAARSSFDTLMTFRDTVSSEPLGGVSVFLEKFGGVGTRVVSEGEASDSGQIWILGAEAGDTVEASGDSQRFGLKSSVAAALAPEDFSWYYGRVGLASGAGISTPLTPVQGSFRLLTSATPLALDYNVVLRQQIPFQAVPQLTVRAESGNLQQTTFATSGDSYEATVALGLPERGTFRVSALDDSSNTYVYSADYVTEPITDSLAFTHLRSSRSDLELGLDSANTTLDQVLIVSTSYPTLRGGLHTSAVQVGRTHSVRSYPDGPWTGSNSVRLRYSDNGLAGTLDPFGSELTIRIHRWDSALASWSALEGAIDTVENFVFAWVDRPGVYAAFTTAISVDIDESGFTIIPQDFDLSENYPNPFNPSTTFKFSLPEPSRVTVDVYNILGRHVARLRDADMPAGVHTVRWNGVGHSGQPVPSGVYFYRLATNEFQEVRKMLLLK